MTGKELMIALVGAGLVGGAAGAATSFATAAKPEAPQTAPEVLDRLKAQDDELAKAKAALEASTKALHELQERVTTAELKAAKAAADAVAAPPATAGGGRVMRFGGRHAAAAGAPTDAPGSTVEFHPDGFQIDLDGADLQNGLGQVGAEIGKALQGLGGQDGALARLDGFRSGLELRNLPEEKRWDKAKEDLGLTWNQVEDLKKAVADRDAAMKEATTTEKKAGPNGGSLTITRPDAAKAAHAQADYHDKVNAALTTDEQKKGWESKGYDHAFGSSPFGGMGGAMVMAIDVQTDKKDDAPKDGK